MNLSYGSICAYLAMMHIELSWADEHYLSTIFNVMGEYAKLGTKPERKKVGSADIGKYVV